MKVLSRWRSCCAGIGRMPGSLRHMCSVVRLPQLSDFGTKNEPVYEYCQGSRERNMLKSELKQACQCTVEIPIVIGNQTIYEGVERYVVTPHYCMRKLAKYYHASEDTIRCAIDTAVAAQVCWDARPIEERMCIITYAAELISRKYRQCLNAATMLGQSKTVVQAELDAACALIDYFRFNVYFLKEHAKYQPANLSPMMLRNALRFRGLEGFVAAITPFNSTSISGMLAYTPVLMGCSVVWKPSDEAVLSCWRIFNILREAGIPNGVVNFVPADPVTFANVITKSPRLAGISFTGTTATFQKLWQTVGQNIGSYCNFPRLVAGCSGKNYHFVHNTADVETVVACTVRSAFEYSGQKCSSCSRMYIPCSLAAPIMQRLLCETGKLCVGDPTTDFRMFTGAVINAKAFERITKYIIDAKKNPFNRIICGGVYDRTCGFFVMPTIIETTDPCDKLMTEEILGPILAVHVYKDECVHNILALVGTTNSYALTGSVFTQDKCFAAVALEALRYTAGTFFINDKSTGAVVNQQPHGGGRWSGTNDKRGGIDYIMRWTSPQTIKETYQPQREIFYPYMLSA